MALPQTPQEFDEAHQRFLGLYNPTAPQGLLKDKFDPPIPLYGLGDSKGRLLAPQELTRTFAQALFVRTTNRYGGVTLPRSHFYVDHGLSQTPVLLWGTGEDLQAVSDHVLLAEYPCHYDRRSGTVTRLRLGHWYPSPFAAAQAQGIVVERTPQASQIVARPPARPRPAAGPVWGEQLRLFAALQSA